VENFNIDRNGMNNLDGSGFDDGEEIESYVKKYIHGTGKPKEGGKGLTVGFKKKRSCEIISERKNNMNGLNDNLFSYGNNEENYLDEENNLDNEEQGYCEDVEDDNMEEDLIQALDEDDKKKSKINLTEKLNNEENKNISNTNSIDKEDLKSERNLTIPQKNKFKDKFPNANNKEAYSSSNNENIIKPSSISNTNNNINVNLPNPERSSLKLKTTKVISNTNTKLNNKDENSNFNGNLNMNNIKDFLMKNFNTVNTNYSDFKKEIGKKLTYQEKKLLEMEHYSKKKLEELAGQIKNFIPINFNAYVKNYDGIKSVNINRDNNDNSDFNENDKVTEKNVMVNIIDPFLVFKNENRSGSLAPTINNQYNIFNTNNKKLNKIKQPIKKNLSTTKLTDLKSVSKDTRFL
jgi:hypothetical protein